MYRNMVQLYRNNQIIDVTKECTFEWLQEPDSITYGTFPNSIKTPNLDDYLEFQSTLTGSGNVARLRITLPKVKFCFPIVYFSSGPQIGTDDAFRYVGCSRGDNTYESVAGDYTARIYRWYAGRFETYGDTQESGLYPTYAKYWSFYFYTSNAGTFSFRIRTLRIGEVLI